jgi:adenine/guanine phosphoribosyltransferase-like PRPP-binding protein
VRQTRADNIRIRIAAIEVLQTLKLNYSHKELASVFHLPIPVLSRYVNGRALPGTERARWFLDIFYKRFLPELVRKRVRTVDHVLDHTRVLEDANLLDKVAKAAYGALSGLNPTKILTVATDGVPIANQVAEEFSIPMVVAKPVKEMGVTEFHEVKRVFSSGTYGFLYVPKRSIRRGDKVLLVDDVVRSGSTIDALFSLCKSIGASPVGLFTVIAFRHATEKMRSLGIPVEVILEI